MRTADAELAALVVLCFEMPRANVKDFVNAAWMSSHPCGIHTGGRLVKSRVKYLLHPYNEHPRLERR